MPDPAPPPGGKGAGRKDLDDYVDDILTGKGGVYEKRMGIKIGDDYTEQYRQASSSAESHDISVADIIQSEALLAGRKDATTASEKKDKQDCKDFISEVEQGNKPSFDDDIMAKSPKQSPSKDTDVEGYADDILAGKGGLYEKRMGVALDHDYTKEYHPDGTPASSPERNKMGVDTTSVSDENEEEPKPKRKRVTPTAVPVVGSHDPFAEEVTNRYDTTPSRNDPFAEDAVVKRTEATEPKNASRNDPFAEDAVATKQEKRDKNEVQKSNTKSQSENAPFAEDSPSPSKGDAATPKPDPKDAEVEGWADDILTGRGGIYEKRMGVGIDDDYTKQYRRQPGDASGGRELPETSDTASYPSTDEETDTKKRDKAVVVTSTTPFAEDATVTPTTEALPKTAKPDPKDAEVEGWADDILTGRGGIYEKRMGVGIDDDYTKQFRRQPGDASGPGQLPETSDTDSYPSSDENAEKSPPPKLTATMLASAAIATTPTPSKSPAEHDADVEDYIDGLLSGRGGIYEKRMGMGIGEDYTKGYGYGGGLGVPFEIPDTSDVCSSVLSDNDNLVTVTAPEEDVDGYVSGLLAGSKATSTGCAHNHANHLFIDDNQECMSEQFSYPSEDEEDDDFYKVPSPPKGKDPCEHDKDVDDYVDGLLTGRGGIYEDRMGCKPGEDWLTKALEASAQPYDRKPLDMPEFDSDTEITSTTDNGGTASRKESNLSQKQRDQQGTTDTTDSEMSESIFFGECATHRRSADDIRIVVKIKGEEVYKAFFLNIETSFKGLQIAVSRKLGGIAQLCYFDNDIDMDVEVDDDESLQLFLEAGHYKLTALREQAPSSSVQEMRAQLNWGTHDCHSTFAQSAKFLPPVDIRAAPASTRAPHIEGIVAYDKSYRSKILDNKLNDPDDATYYKRSRNAEGGESRGGSASYFARKRNEMRLNRAHILKEHQARPDGHIPQHKIRMFNQNDERYQPTGEYEHEMWNGNGDSEYGGSFTTGQDASYTSRQRRSVAGRQSFRQSAMAMSPRRSVATYDQSEMQGVTINL